jgi:hypothetical protein
MGFFDFIFGPIIDRLQRIEDEVYFFGNRQEAQMSATQQKLDELKGVMTDLVAKVTAVFDGMQEAKDDPAELQVLIDQGKAVTAAADAILNPPPPTP